MSIELESSSAAMVEQDEGGEHGEIVSLLNASVSNYVYSHGLGRVFEGQTDFELPGIPGSKRPDVAFVEKSRLPHRVPSNVLLAPDLAVEVISPSDTVGGIYEKIQQYMAGGVKLLWVVEPNEQVVRVYQPGQPFQLLRADQDLTGTAEVLPGFSMPIAMLFSDNDQMIQEVFARLLGSS